MSFGRALIRLLAAERPARAVAICRIGIGLAAFIIGLKTAHDLFLLRRPEFVRAPPFDWMPAFESTGAILAFAGVWIAASFGLIIGYRARWCALGLVAGTVLRFLIDQNMWSNHTYFVGLALLLLSLTESDASLSVRWVREGRPERQVTAWPLVLLQLQLSIVYFYSAIAKMNPTFLGGEILSARLSVPGVVDNPVVIKLASVATIGLELFLSFALWIPSLRYWGFLAGAVFHALIPLSIHLYAGLVAFSIATLSPYILFLDDRPGSRVVIWDDHCGFCRSWVRLFRRFDWLRIHRFEGASSDVLAAGRHHARTGRRRGQSLGRRSRLRRNRCRPRDFEIRADRVPVGAGAGAAGGPVDRETGLPCRGSSADVSDSGHTVSSVTSDQRNPSPS